MNALLSDAKHKQWGGALMQEGAVQLSEEPHTRWASPVSLNNV